jgi:hypothetical protein
MLNILKWAQKKRLDGVFDYNKFEDLLVRYFVNLGNILQYFGKVDV